MCIRDRPGPELEHAAAATFVRGELAAYMRRHPYYVDLLIGGWDQREGSVLYYVDFLGGMQRMPYGAHGYAGYFVTSILDRYYTPELTRDEGMEIMRKCVAEIKQRFMVHSPNFLVKAIDAQGVYAVELE
eukprot:TRINITY_DN14324_c0_g1_i2.p1 TRINITY_DN14324_c0_g1~~TRINITY_DN14324_c0_g1_i2.p1  ORF type:complete len:130 (+),score=27.55 TRINITY_DN14324_c0_g1_i2:191-580(+)